MHTQRHERLQHSNCIVWIAARLTVWHVAAYDFGDSRDIEVLTGEKQECDGHVEKLKTHQLVLQSKCVFVNCYIINVQ